MAKKSRKPALYELLKSNRAGPERVTPPDFPEEPSAFDDEDLEARPAWFTPGRTIHLPVGYIFAAVAVGVALVVGAYIVGYMRGETVGKMVTEEMFATGNNDRTPAGHGFANDPLAGGGDVGDADQPGQPRPNTNGSSTTRPPGARDQTAQWGPIQSDPRQPGRYYFRLIETREEGAKRLAAFCREHGLEAYMARANNASQWRVFVLPGFTPAERQAGADAALRSKIRRVGNMWKVQGGATNLGDAYPVRYDG